MFREGSLRVRNKELRIRAEEIRETTTAMIMEEVTMLITESNRE